MSLYSFAEANLTTAADRKRRPAVTEGQVARTLAVSVAMAVGLVGLAVHQSSHAHADALRMPVPASVSAPAQS